MEDAKFKVLQRELARRDYEYLLLQQSHVPVEGLWAHDGRHVVVCAVELDQLRSRDGRPLAEWLAANRRIGSLPLIFAKGAPEGSVRVSERTVDELTALSGNSFNPSDFREELAFRLRGRFPYFQVRTKPPTAIVRVERQLSTEQLDLLRDAFDELCPYMFLEVEVGPTGSGAPVDALSLISSSSLASPFSREARWFCEADEDIWADHRQRLLGGGPPSSGSDILAHGMRQRAARCFVDATAFEPPNIRTLLPIFEKVVLSLPVENCWLANLRALGLAKNEFIHLAEAGRLEVVLSMSLHRYPADIINELLERAPEALVGPRRLTAVVVESTRQRMPLLYPGVGVNARRQALRYLDAQVQRLGSSSDRHVKLAEGTVRALRKAWTVQEYFLQRRGAFGAAALGVGPMMSNLISALDGRDFFLELQQVGHQVEVGAALGATVVPIMDDGGHFQTATELCASVYSGGPGERSVLQLAPMTEALGGLLGIDEKTPIRELTETFSGRDVERLRSVLIDLTSKNQDPEFLRAAVESFNAKVRKFKRKKKRLSRISLVGTMAALAGGAGFGAPWVPFTALAAGFLLAGPDLKGAPGWLLDSIRGLNALASPGVVLVSRLKER